VEETAAIKDDGLLMPEIGSWGEEKYRHVALYSALFVKAMRNKWDCLLYIDLFSGAGRSRIRGTTRIVNASPMVVLGLYDKFDRYIFCEKERKKSEALRKRIKKDFSHLDTNVIYGDANKKVTEILGKMPAYRKDYHVLAFCFVDPYALNNLRFDTLRELATRYMDFLVLIPSGMDAHRFESIYVKPDNFTIDEFLGSNDWRSVWAEVRKRGLSFERFIVQQFGESMETLGYLRPSLDDTKLMRSDEKNLLLYRLVLYSRHALGKEFWRQTKKYSQSQQEMF